MITLSHGERRWTPVRSDPSPSKTHLKSTAANTARGYDLVGRVPARPGPGVRMRQVSEFEGLRGRRLVLTTDRTKGAQ